jgi:hypothetical protein
MCTCVSVLASLWLCTVLPQGGQYIWVIRVHKSKDVGEAFAATFPALEVCETSQLCGGYHFGILHVAHVAHVVL